MTTTKSHGLLYTLEWSPSTAQNHLLLYSLVIFLLPGQVGIDRQGMGTVFPAPPTLAFQYLIVLSGVKGGGLSSERMCIASM